MEIEDDSVVKPVRKTMGAQMVFNKAGLKDENSDNSEKSLAQSLSSESLSSENENGLEK